MTCGELDHRDLPTVTAYEIYIGAGFEAVIGWPLPNGLLPVGAANLGVVMAAPAEVAAYRDLCAAERAANPAG
jgi:hypothetical protein